MPLPDPLTAANQRASARDAERIVELERQLDVARRGCRRAAHVLKFYDELSDEEIARVEEELAALAQAGRAGHDHTA